MIDKKNALFMALSKFQGEIVGAKKKTEGFNYKYSDLQTVWEMIRKPLSSNGLSVHQAVHDRPGGKVLVTTIYHKDGSSIHDGGIPLLLNKRDMQGIGSAITYARRYGLMAGLGIASEDDDGVRAGLEPEFISQKEVNYIKECTKNFKGDIDLKAYFELLKCKNFESIPKEKYFYAIELLKQKEQSLKSKSNG